MNRLDSVHPKILNSLRQRGLLSDEEIIECLSYFERKSYKKKENFLSIGEICQNRGYINRGCFRRFSVNEGGKEVILNFALEDWWIGDLESYEDKKPTIYNIQALEDSEVFCITHSNHDKLCDAIPKYKTFHEEKKNRAHFASIKRLTMQAATAEEKYLNFMNQQPELFQRIPMHYIASYLGLEPESFSRLRKRIIEKDKKS